MPKSKRRSTTDIETKNDVDKNEEGECAYNAKRICNQSQHDDNRSLVIVEDDDNDVDLEESLFGTSTSTAKDNQNSKSQSESLQIEDETKVDNGSLSTKITPLTKTIKNSENVVDLTEDGDDCNENIDDLFEPFDKSENIQSIDSSSKSNTQDQTTNNKVDLAKKKLSKWAARLFDPNRPRGLIETPTVIPLNDEFLKEFGKREKTFHESTGQRLNIDTEKINSIEPDEEREEDIDRKDIDKDRKVKISNLAYATSLATLTKKVQEFGVVEDVNLVMDENGKKQNNIPLSIGRAYVTFSSPEEASKCIDLLNDTTLEGRVLRVFRAQERNKRAKGSEKNNLSLNRYWEKDITSKCFRCGGVGHLKDQCTNAEIQRPCTLCSQVGHEMWKCPVGTHCFNCGVPGHVSRDCPYGRSLPNRVVCGMCFTSGHHRWQCKISPENIYTPDTICINCGKLGHFSCRDMKWSFGLNGLYCYNCGLKGHHGSDCIRPNVDVCLKNQGIAMQEIERSKNWTEINDLAKRELDKAFNGNGHKQSHKRGRSSGINHDVHRPRPKSQPPHNRANRQHGFSRNNTTRQRGYVSTTSISPPPHPPQRGYRSSHFHNSYNGNHGYT